MRIYRVEFAGLDQGSDDRPVGATLVAAREERILAIESNLAVILPISGMRLSSMIPGIRCTAGARVVF